MHVVDIIKGEKDKLDEAFFKKLCENIFELTTKMYITSEFLDLLVEDRILTTEEKGQLLAIKKDDEYETRTAINAKLLRILERSSSQHHRLFIDSLIRTGQKNLVEACGLLEPFLKHDSEIEKNKSLLAEVKNVNDLNGSAAGSQFFRKAETQTTDDDNQHQKNFFKSFNV